MKLSEESFENPLKDSQANRRWQPTILPIFHVYSWATKGLAIASIPSTGQINTTAVPLEKECQKPALIQMPEKDLVNAPADNQAKGACVIGEPGYDQSRILVNTRYDAKCPNLYGSSGSLRCSMQSSRTIFRRGSKLKSEKYQFPKYWHQLKAKCIESVLTPSAPHCTPSHPRT